LSSLTVSALISEGVRLYDAGQFEESLRVYEAAVARSDGKQLRVFNGLYLSNKQLNRNEAAEHAFGQIVALGLSTNSLAFKFLFKPASTDFLADPKISAPYDMWLRVLAKEIAGFQPLCDDSGPLQPHRLGAGQRTPVTVARHHHAAQAGSAGARADWSAYNRRAWVFVRT
jgi:hypothetical protein